MFWLIVKDSNDILHSETDKEREREKFSKQSHNLLDRDISYARFIAHIIVAFFRQHENLSQYSFPRDQSSDDIVHKYAYKKCWEIDSHFIIVIVVAVSLSFYFVLLFFFFGAKDDKLCMNFDLWIPSYVHSFFFLLSLTRSRVVCWTTHKQQLKC